MNKYTCPKCQRLLCVGDLKDGVIQIKCKKCKSVVEFNSKSKSTSSAISKLCF